MPSLPFSLRIPSQYRSLPAAAFVLLAIAVTSTRSQIISTPEVDTTLSAYPGATLPIAVQADSKLLVSGDSFLINGITQRGIARLNVDWTLDPGFAVGTGVERSEIAAIVVDAEQKILIAGSFTTFSGQAAAGLVRLLPNGTRDPTFTYDGPGRVLQVVPRSTGGYFIIADDSSSNIRWHGADGALVRLLPRPVDLVTDPSSSEPLGSDLIQNSEVIPLAVAELTDGKIIGGFLIVRRASATRNSHVRAVFAFGSNGQQLTDWPSLRPAASFTATFDVGRTGQSMQLAPTPNGGFYVLCSGSVFIANGSIVPSVSRYRANGTTDPGFAAPALTARGTVPFAGAFDSAGRFVISGAQFVDPAYPTTPRTTVRLLDSGAIDSQFGLPSPGQFSSDVRFGALRRGTTPADDRVVMHAQGGLIAYKPTNSLTLGAASALPPMQVVTVGKDLSLTAVGAGQNIHWQISTDGSLTWTNLTDGAAYQGTSTPTLAITGAGAALDRARYRFVSTNLGGTVASNATTLKVAPMLFPFPAAITLDAAGNLYVGDAVQHTIQRIDPAGKVESHAGTAGQTGSADGLGAAARFNQPGGLCASPAGELFVGDTANGSIRRITNDGAVTTVAGSFTMRGGTDGPGSQALFAAPTAIARNAAGIHYVADSSNHTIRVIALDGTVSTLAGNAGVAGASDGQGPAARFSLPNGIAVGSDGTIFVADTNNHLVRRVSPNGIVTTVAGVPAIAGYQDGTGTAALFNQPTGLGIDAAGNLYVADTGNSVIRKISPAGAVITLAGLATVGGHKDGTGTEAWFNQPKALAVTGGGEVFVADTGNAAIRRISTAGVVATLDLKIGAPRILTQPSNQTVTSGGSVMLVVAATGGGALTYQWYKDGAIVSGATATTFGLFSVLPSDAGSYTVTVSNDAGSITSNPATLSVQPGTTAVTPTPNAGGSGGGGAPSWPFLLAIAASAFLRSWQADRRAAEFLVNNR